MASFNRKKYKRYANRVIRELNEAVARDPVFKGRYYAHQRAAIDHPLSDRSGRIYVVEVEFIDRYTGAMERKYWDATYWLDDVDMPLWMEASNFIMKCEHMAKSGDGDFRYDIAHGVARYLPHSPHNDDSWPKLIDKSVTWCKL